MDHWDIMGTMCKIIPAYLESHGQLDSLSQTTKPDYSRM